VGTRGRLFLYTYRMDWLANLIDVSRLSSLGGGAGEALREPRGLFALLVLVLLVLYGLSVGKTKALVSLLSIYIAYVLTVLFPFMDVVLVRLPQQAQQGGVALLFLVLYIATFLLLSHAMTKGRLTLGEISVTRVVIISIVQLGLIASMTLSLVPTDLAAYGLGGILPFLAGERALWIWAAGSLLILPFMRAKPRSHD
jgi:hypothetical protein